jgi:hypothetical protein
MKKKKNLLLLLVLSAFLIMGAGCRTIHPRYHSRGQVISTKPHGKVPPGQMKKLTGAKSAKAYAPGQQKKHKRK